jgi:hypothetical protein
MEGVNLKLLKIGTGSFSTKLLACQRGKWLREKSSNFKPTELADTKE